WRVFLFGGIDMNSALLYRQHGRCIFWIAFISALAIRLGAVALAKTKPPTTKLEDLSLLGDVELVDVAESEPALEESVTSPPLEQIHPDQDSFREENVTPPSVRAHRKARPPSFVRGTTASLRSVKAMMAYAPRPVIRTKRAANERQDRASPCSPSIKPRAL